MSFLSFCLDSTTLFCRYCILEQPPLDTKWVICTDDKGALAAFVYKHTQSNSCPWIQTSANFDPTEFGSISFSVGSREASFIEGHDDNISSRWAIILLRCFAYPHFDHSLFVPLFYFLCLFRSFERTIISFYYFSKDRPPTVNTKKVVI